MYENIHLLVGCLRLCKDTKIKANHNALFCLIKSDKLSKTLQRYENKSKSQLSHWGVDIDFSCLRLCKDTKIKANHNIYHQWKTTI